MAPQKKKRSSASGRKSSRAARRPAPVRRVTASTKKTAKARPTRQTASTKGGAVTFGTSAGVVTVGGAHPRAHPRGANGQFIARAAAPAVVSVPESRVYEEALTLAAGSFPESRFFNSANALLGYIEGRPGVKGLLAVFPAQSGAPAAAWTPERRQEVRERLEASPPAQEKRDDTSGAGPSYATWLERLMETLEWADDGGALVEVEVESDSGGDS